MKMGSKRLAYGFLVVCIAVTGYVLYDTFRIATGDSSGDSAEENSTPAPDPGEILISFDDYDIEERTSTSLLEEQEGSKVLYLFENEQACEDGAFDPANENLLASVSFSGVQGEYVIESVSVFKRTIEGNNTEISSIPTVSFELNTEETESGGLKGDLKLVWDERTLEGEFDTLPCENI